MPAYYLAIATPFYCGGLAVGLLLTRGSGQVNRLYAVDLVGAGPGLRRPLHVIMPALGGSGSVLLAAGIGLIAAAVFGLAQARATFDDCAVAGHLCVRRARLPPTGSFRSGSPATRPIVEISTRSIQPGTPYRRSMCTKWRRNGRLQTNRATGPSSSTPVRPLRASTICARVFVHTSTSGRKIATTRRVSPTSVSPGQSF